MPSAHMRLLGIFLLPIALFIAMAGAAADVPLHHGTSSNPDHLDGAFTGGFGEETCHSCHFDHEVNNDLGSLSLQGIEDPYQPGEAYEVIVAVESEELEIGGFQMTARFEDGSQAGEFAWDGDHLMLTPSISDEVQYVQHGPEGTEPTDERRVTWMLTWRAPTTASGPVIFNVAANAGNDDDSPFGDWIYVKERSVAPGQ